LPHPWHNRTPVHLRLEFRYRFQGGTLIQIQTPVATDAGHLRTTLSHLGLGEIQLQAFGTDTEF